MVDIARFTVPRFPFRTVSALAFAALLGAPADAQAPDEGTDKALGSHVAIGWNDLGMHCMNNDFEGIAILPPFNNLWVQVVRRGNPPELLSDGVSLEYRFPANTESASKTNFWDYEDKLFGVDLPQNVGLTGHGMTGILEWNGTAWEATGVPIVPFDDATPTVEQPYQLAQVTLKDGGTGNILDQTEFVVPVSVEINCGLCHNGGKGAPADMAHTTPDARLAAAKVSPSVVWHDILDKHEDVDGGSLLNQTPVLCAKCHASNALGTTGRAGVPNLSRAIHRRHGAINQNMDCYSCHPGGQTQCLRGAMYLAGKTCADCHGNVRTVGSSIANGRRPWLDEPRCETCHPTHPENAGTLYRNSVGHGGLYCAACHGSPHAELPTAQQRDGIQATRLQGTAAPLGDCLVCHTTFPAGDGPHGLKAPSALGTMWSLF